MSAPVRSPEAYAFGPFRLEVHERRLLRGEEPLRLRAKVFDTLVVLVRNAGSLVQRGDLLEAVWPRAIVEESNLSHNISALRRILRTEDAGPLIETVPRRGYRFTAAVTVLDPTPSPEPPARDDELERARHAFEQGAWTEALESYRAAEAQAELGAADQARLAWAARWAGRFDEVVPLLERAAAAYRREEDPVGAARVAVDLALTLLERRRPSLAASYLRQAERYLPDDPRPGTPAAETLAWLSWVRNRLTWLDGDWEAAAERGRELLALARRLEVRDAEALAHGDIGHALLALGRYVEATRSLEEVGALAMADELGLYATGIVFCGLVFAWRTFGRLEQATEWTDAYTRWSDREGVAYFPGLCRVHRGELTCLRGELERAERDLEEGSRELALADSGLAAAGFRELGVVRLRRGDLEGAEEAFRRTLEFGMEPEPGLARLRAARGEREEALRGLARFLGDDGERPLGVLDREARASALGTLVTLALATDELPRAREAADELRSVAKETGSAMYRAAADQAEGEILLRERLPGAVELLGRCVQGWTELDLPYEAGLAREMLAQAYLDEGDPARARLELGAALATFERLGAELDRQRLRRRLSELDSEATPAPGRTGRTVFVCGEILDAPALRSALGEDAWADLAGWLDRRLRACWDDHGGRAIETRGGYGVAFERLEDALRCTRHVQRSLREHRLRHGFAPPLRVGIFDGGAAPEPDEAEALSLALRTAAAGEAGRITLLTTPEVGERLGGARTPGGPAGAGERAVFLLPEDPVD